MEGFGACCSSSHEAPRPAWRRSSAGTGAVGSVRTLGAHVGHCCVGVAQAGCGGPSRGLRNTGRLRRRRGLAQTDRRRVVGSIPRRRQAASGALPSARSVTTSSVPLSVEAVACLHPKIPWATVLVEHSGTTRNRHSKNVGSYSRHSNGNHPRVAYVERPPLSCCCSASSAIKERGPQYSATWVPSP